MGQPSKPLGATRATLQGLLSQPVESSPAYRATEEAADSARATDCLQAVLRDHRAIAALAAHVRHLSASLLAPADIAAAVQAGRSSPLDDNEKVVLADDEDTLDGDERYALELAAQRARQFACLLAWCVARHSVAEEIGVYPLLGEFAGSHGKEGRGAGAAKADAKAAAAARDDALHAHEAVDAEVAACVADLGRLARDAAADTPAPRRTVRATAATVARLLRALDSDLAPHIAHEEEEELVLAVRAAAALARSDADKLDGYLGLAARVLEMLPFPDEPAAAAAADAVGAGVGPGARAALQRLNRIRADIVDLPTRTQIQQFEADMERQLLGAGPTATFGGGKEAEASREDEAAYANFDEQGDDDYVESGDSGDEYDEDVDSLEDSEDDDDDDDMAVDLDEGRQGSNGGGGGGGGETQTKSKSRGDSSTPRTVPVRRRRIVRLGSEPAATQRHGNTDAASDDDDNGDPVAGFHFAKRSAASPGADALTCAVLADHRGLLAIYRAMRSHVAGGRLPDARRWLGQLLWAAARHSAAEDAAVYPAMQQQQQQQGDSGSLSRRADSAHAEHEEMQRAGLALARRMAQDLPQPGEFAFLRDAEKLMARLGAHIDDEEEADLPDLAARMRPDDQEEAARLFLAVKRMAPGRAAVMPAGNADAARVVREADAKLRELRGLVREVPSPLEVQQLLAGIDLGFAREE
ncbi:hypothetical protein HK405_012630 [Cladochytrium tenue]|nr:hypothetical protein HK405_012630 [Cladochytrium tenue]